MNANSVEEVDLDAMILSVAKVRWQKVAMVLGKVVNTSSDRYEGLSFEAVAARIEALVQAGQLEAQGNLSRWRHSEVRLPTQATG